MLTEPSHGRSTDGPPGAGAPAKGVSRVTAPGAPPAGTTVRHEEFRGPLFQCWGERMRGAALAAVLPTPSRARARLEIPDVTDREAWASCDRTTTDALLACAERERGSTWPEARATVFARFVRDGDRVDYESRVFARQRRLTRAVVAAAITDDDAWHDEAADGAVLLCEQGTWCWPAHDDALTAKGLATTDKAHPQLDLGAGEVVAQLAVADRVLGPRWDSRLPGVRDRIRWEAEQRVFTPFETRDDLWWLGFWREVNNWNPWILSNVLMAAVLLVDDPDRLARLLARALESLDRYVATLPADGAIDEGVGYWWNGAARLLEALDTVARITENALDPSAIPVVSEVLRFPMRMQLGGDWYVNVADGRARIGADGAFREPWQLPFRWGIRLGDDRVVRWARSARRPGEPIADAGIGLPRLVRTLTDASWRDATPAAPPLPRSVWLPSVQLAVLRAEAGVDEGLTLMAKGGHNDENHNHKDVGSFVLAVDGRPLLVDVGKPTYTAQTFGPRRYTIRAMRSAWHNAPAPLGLEQGEGVGYHAEVLRAPEGEPSTTRRTSRRAGSPRELTLSLSAAYPLAEDDRWVRTFRYVSHDRVQIDDRWSLHRPTDAAFGEVHLVATGDVEAIDGGVRVTDGARGLLVRTGPVLPVVLEPWPLDDPELTAVWGRRLTRIVFPLPGGDGALTTIVEVDR